MGSFRYPFLWGSVSATTSASTTTSVSTARWATLGQDSQGWDKSVRNLHRFEPIFTQPRGVFGQSINFIYQVQSQFPFIVKTQFPVIIISTITNP